MPYEPLRFLFFGEEAFQLARLWAAGWDVFAPPAAAVFHQWSRAGRHTFQAEVPQARACAQLCAPQMFNRLSCIACSAVMKTATRAATLQRQHVDGLLQYECAWHLRLCKLGAGLVHLHCWAGHALHWVCKTHCYPLQDAEAEAASRRRVAQLLSGEGGAHAAQPVAGSGAEARASRGVRALGAHCGVDFAARVVSERARRGGVPDGSLFASS